MMASSAKTVLVRCVIATQKGICVDYTENDHLWSFSI